MQEWWRSAVIYQVYPRSYQDETGDGVGDLRGITRRLPYIADLGADCIWLSPIFASPQADMGYDVSDYMAVDPLFGTMDEFDALITAAHDLDLKVIVDQVLSHTSDQHDWFKESRKDRTNDKADWYVWADPLPDGSPPTNWHSHFGGPAWEFDPGRGQYYQHNFLTSQPDLNFHNPDVVKAILETCKFWLERGLDGFRLDTVNYYFHDDKLRSNPAANAAPQVMATDLYGMQDNIYNKTRPENLAFLEQLRALADQYDDIMMVGEVGEMGHKSIEIMGRYTEGTNRLHMAYSFAMLGPDFNAEHFRNCIEGFQSGAPEGHPYWSFSNHDVPRQVTRWAEHSVSKGKMARFACAMLMSFEGTIGIYQGEELGQTETEMEFHELTDPPAIRFWPTVKGRDGCRTPMVWEKDAKNAGFSKGKPWLPVKAEQAAKAVDQQGDDSILAFYKAMIARRKASPAMTVGQTTFIDLPEPLLAFTRTADGETLTFVFNLSKDSQIVTVTGDPAVEFSGEAALDTETLTLSGNGFAYLTHAGDITLSAK
ncbi:alpha-glucosidase family protein [Octadecabacter sp.]|nr:alpha-glucosidase family protein [Octadecabacter sp.]MDC1297561.1 alpha-glucosidase family protein [Octadecabacter sp.]MDC1381300.1 alpha-glucosidase family protein [Octadecabacter sp.]MDC1398676.1 alpha-glucosidase family protein [Octadecabacter sp.]MDC1500701.1 alpha-glucosidase family protein [Octadecabacter sp.]